MDEYMQQRATEIEQAIGRVSETLRYALINEKSGMDGNTSIKQRLQWIQEATTSQSNLLLGIHVAAWITALSVVVAVVHHW